MSLHFVSHAWQVEDVADGTRVRITPRDLDDATVAVLTDELFDLVLESGRPNLHLDLREAGILPSLVVGKLFALERRLHTIGGRLYLYNLDPALADWLKAQPETTEVSAPW